MSEKYLYVPPKNENVKLNVWCAFPAVYNFGMSALGYLTVFQRLDMLKGIQAERIFTDSETTFSDVRNIDVISFSVSFELDCSGVLSILEKYKIPFLSQDRTEETPIICGGGPVLSANPEPFAQFFDFIMIGDAEPHLEEIFTLLRDNAKKSKKEKLELLSKIEGIYIPSKKEAGYKVKKATSRKQTNCTYTPILTENSFFANTFIVEVERGCLQNCAFCLTSYINKPVRFFSYEDIIEKIETGLKYTNKIALLGALICAHPRIDDICQYLIDKADVIEGLEVSVSSLRADYVSDKTLEMLHKCGQKTATIAIEAGSERLRRVINKNLTKENIFSIVEKMVNHGFNGLKMYGMVGLPTETYEDIDEFVSLCKEIKSKYKGFNLIPSFSTFVPKAQTPFVYARREDTKSLEKKNEYIKKQFAKIGIKARTSSVKWDYVQTLLSRGGRELTPYLIEVYKNGGNLGAFKSVYKDFSENGRLVKTEAEVIAEQPFCEMPWDFIEYCYEPKTLYTIYKKLIFQ